MQTSEGPVLWEQTRGCPQGSCSGPAFWNIVVDEILSVQWPQGVHLQAFADDFEFIVTDNTKEWLRKINKLALGKFKEWADKNKLRVSMEKSSYVLFIKLIIEQGKRAMDQYQHLCRIAGKTWGINKNIRRLLYKTIIERTLCHVAAA
ncbi:hypothetical protein AVEN_82254-1 [Araneus ventricosus]|uniref:Reverse transcriptase domain-containing protein n=1 Tax=Araneus ventricosus TaxID=182803 RepID=A0A4Y2HDP9_ARAVE|nr:hypothetical protein AVEN_82254-1 [Araneus ventricosus]